MATNVEFIAPNRVRILTDDGAAYVMGFLGTANYQINQQSDGLLVKVLAEIFDKHYDGTQQSIHGPILRAMYLSNIGGFGWLIADNNDERKRIGNRIKALRKEQEMDAKSLATRVGVDPGYLSRVEQGRISVGLDILNKIAGVLNCKIDFVPLIDKEIALNV